MTSRARTQQFLSHPGVHGVGVGVRVPGVASRRRMDSDHFPRLRMVGTGGGRDGVGSSIARTLVITWIQQFHKTVASAGFPRSARKLGSQVGLSKIHGSDVELRSPGCCCSSGTLAKFQLVACRCCCWVLCFEDHFDWQKKWCSCIVGSHRSSWKAERRYFLKQSDIGSWNRHSRVAVDAQLATDHLGLAISSSIQLEAMLVCLLSLRAISGGWSESQEMCPECWLSHDLRRFEGKDPFWPWLLLHGLLAGPCKSGTFASARGFFDAPATWEDVPVRMCWESTWGAMLHSCHTTCHVPPGCGTRSLAWPQLTHLIIVIPIQYMYVLCMCYMPYETPYSISYHKYVYKNKYNTVNVDIYNINKENK